jgi:hypothetical protein
MYAGSAVIEGNARRITDTCNLSCRLFSAPGGVLKMLSWLKIIGGKRMQTFDFDLPAATKRNSSEPFEIKFIDECRI